ncbi:MAG: GNAT family N-acetyltransferase [Lachnospiraceae bacterium]|nr:GNAT family N-acetyltransferase [Lachnospiraceae bacterium]
MGRIVYDSRSERKRKLENEMDEMEVIYGSGKDIDMWMKLVVDVRKNFPGLETEAGLQDHKRTVLRFMDKKQAICIKEENIIIGVMLFSRVHNMICCLAVSPQHRRKGVASRLLDTALHELDRERNITVSTFREGDMKGLAPRALYKK